MFRPLLLVVVCATLIVAQRSGNSIKERGSRRIQQPPRDEDLREIERQNTITAQILENFLERRLFPNKRPTHRLPTLDEILPRPATTERPTPPPWLRQHRERLSNNTAPTPFDVVDLRNDSEESREDEAYDDEDDDGGGLGSAEDQDYNYRDPESLQSVESEQIDRYLDSFRKRIEGRSLIFNILLESSVV